MAQNSDLTTMDIVQMDYEPLFCQWPLHPAALDSMTAMELPAKQTPYTQFHFRPNCQAYEPRGPSLGPSFTLGT